jgi:uncharacterized protein
MKIVLDTNVLLVCISERSKLHWIFQKLKEGAFQLCVTTDILAEYAEIIGRHMGSQASEAVLGVLMYLPNLQLVTIYYKFHLLLDDDDNKFVDCAIAANADFIVSHDRDFRPLSSIDFPSVTVLDHKQFKILLDTQP